MADGVTSLDQISYGTTTGGAAGTAETTLTLGVDRLDARTPPDLYHVWAAQLNAVKNVVLKISQDNKGGTRLGTRVQAANPFGAGESGFYIDSAGIGYVVFNGTPQALGSGSSLGNWVFTANDASRVSSGPLTIGADGNATTLGIGSSTFGTLTLTGARLLLSQRALTSGTQASALAITGGAHTALTASTENFDVNLSLARTVEFSAGALTTQRAVMITAPTYAFTGASTLTNAATLAVSGAPIAGTNATITNRFAVWIQSGNLALAPAGSIVSASQGATNTVGMILAPNVADGASSVGFSLDLATAISSGQLFRIRNVTTTLLTGKLLSTDGITLADGGGSASLGLSTTGASATLAYGAGNVAVTSTSINITPNNGIATVNAELKPFSDAGAGLTIGDASNRWLGMYSAQVTVKAKASTTTSLASFSDSSGNARFGVDESGLDSLGYSFDQRYNWLAAGQWAGTINLVASTATPTTPAGAYADWVYTSSVNATGSVLTSGFASNSPAASGLSIGTGTASTNAMLVRTPLVLHPGNLSNMKIICEGPVNVSTAGTGANSAYTVRWGLANGGISVTNPGGYFFQKTSASANWFAVTDDGAANTPVDTGVAFTTNAQYLRIEYYGAGTTVGGGTKTVKFYIDNTLVATRTANVYSASSVGFQAWATATGAITQQSLAIGPVRVKANLVASALVP